MTRAGAQAGKDQINVVVREENGEKRRAFEAITKSQGELVGAAK